MFKLLLNYIRDQKNNWVQIIGLGFLIIIMVASFLSLTFGANYVNDDYKNNIAGGKFHQDITFYNMNVKFKQSNITKTWLENMDYVTREEDDFEDTIDLAKITNATFQLQKLPEYNADTNDYLYRFYFEDNAKFAHVGREFAKKTNRGPGEGYIDFKLALPFNYYVSGQTPAETVAAEAAIIERFVYDPNNPNDANQTNFFIMNRTSALNYYQNNIKGNVLFPYAKRDYTTDDVDALAKLYNYLVLGMLWGDNIAWNRATMINDLLVSGKTFNFIQTTPNDQVNVPVLTSPPVRQFLDSKNLADGEILIYDKFAATNNLKVGQDYFFSGYKFTIAGFATSAFSANNSVYFNGINDNRNQTVAFVNQTTFEKISSDPFASIYNNNIFVFNPDEAAKQITSQIDNDWLYKYFHQALVKDKSINKTNLYGIDNGVESELLFGPLVNSHRFSILESWSWSVLQELTNIFVDIASVFLVLIFIVAGVIIFIVVFKMIDRNKQLIGILKANGYQNWKISVALVSAIIFPIILFAIIAVGLSVVISHFIVVAYSSTMMLVNYGYPFYWLLSLVVVTVPIVVLFLISFFLINLVLRVDALTLIHNSWAKTKYYFRVGNFFKELSMKVTKNFTFQNKLALTTTFRSFGKVVFVSLVSVFASTLLLFSLSATGLVNNMLGLQFASVNYRFNSQYKFTGQTYNNFVNSNKLLYRKESTESLFDRDSLYEPLRIAVEEALNNPDQPVNFDFQYGYIRGSELQQIRTDIIEPVEQWPQQFQDFWNQNIYWINYLTNNNGQNKEDLIINFGLMPYDVNKENPYTQMALSDAHDFDINSIDTDKFYFDNDTQIFVGDWSEVPGVSRTVQGVNIQTDNYLNPSLRNSNFRSFANLDLSSMAINGGWLNNGFLQIRQRLIDKFNISDPEESTVKIIPMVGSTVSGAKNKAGGDGNNIGKTVLYRYNSFKGNRPQYIIGIVYDGARNLLPNTVLMPEQWLKQSLFYKPDYNNDQELVDNLIDNFANSKFSNFDTNELKHYLPIISEKNDYNIDLTQVVNPGYLTGGKAIDSGLSLLYDVNSVKDILTAQQYTFQILILLFAAFSVLLSFMIVIIISNINIRDNLILINILRSLGYSSMEVSYIFLVVMMPLIVIFSLFATLLAPLLTGFLATSLASVVSQQIPIIFLWWYYAIPVFIVVLIYLISFIITWKLNVNNHQLMNLTK